MYLLITELQNSLNPETCYKQIVVQNVTVLWSSYEAMKGICSIIYITNLQKKSEKMGENRKKWTVISSIYI